MERTPADSFHRIGHLIPWCGVANVVVKMNNHRFLSVGTNLIALYRALGGGWELGLGKDFIPEHTLVEMRQRTDWGNLMPP